MTLIPRDSFTLIEAMVRISYVGFCGLHDITHIEFYNESGYEFIFKTSFKGDKYYVNLLEPIKSIRKYEQETI